MIFFIKLTRKLGLSFLDWSIRMFAQNVLLEVTAVDSAIVAHGATMIFYARISGSSGSTRSRGCIDPAFDHVISQASFVGIATSALVANVRSSISCAVSFCKNKKNVTHFSDRKHLAFNLLVGTGLAFGKEFLGFRADRDKCPEAPSSGSSRLSSLRVSSAFSGVAPRSSAVKTSGQIYILVIVLNNYNVIYPDRWCR